MTASVDVHHHALPPLYTAELAGLGIEALPGYGFPEWSPELSLQMMDGNGIERAVLSVSAPGVSFGDPAAARRLARACNEYLADLAASEPRFKAFASVPLPEVADGVGEARYALDELGLDGVVLFTNSDGIYPGDVRLTPLHEELAERGAVVLVHPIQPCGQVEAPLGIRPSILEFVFESTRAATSLVANRTLARFPGIRWIIPHGGGTLPYLAERLGHLRRDRAVPEREAVDVEGDLAGFYFDVTSTTRPHALACLAAVARHDHLLFGTDFPFEQATTVAAAVAELEANPAVAAGGALAGLWRENAAGLLSPSARNPAAR